MRFPVLKVEEMTPRQREVSEVIEARSADGFTGTCLSLIYSPEVAERVQLLGDYLHFNLRVPERLRVLAILVAAGQHRSADVEPFVHLDSTQKSGLSQGTIAALAEGRRPSQMQEDEVLVYDFCDELMKTGRVKNMTFDRLENRVGREVCLELVHVCGYTAFLTTVLNVTQTSLASDTI